MKQYTFGCAFCRDKTISFHIIIHEDLTIVAKCSNCNRGIYLGKMDRVTLKRNQKEGMIT